MIRVWVATASDTDADGSWEQLVTYDAADVIHFQMQFPDCHVAEWELPDKPGGGAPEMVGP